MKTAIKTVTMLRYYANAEWRLYTKVFYKSGREKTYYGFEIPNTVHRFMNHTPETRIEYDDHIRYIYGDELK